MSNLRFRRLLGLVLACLAVPCSGVSGIIHTESAIFTEGVFGGEVRVDLEIEDLGPTRIWRYTVTNLSFAPLNRNGVPVTLEVFGLGWFNEYGFLGLDPGLADDVTVPPGWGFWGRSLSSVGSYEQLYFSGSGLDIGEQGLFAFSETKYVVGNRFPPHLDPVPLGPHEITHSSWVVLGDYCFECFGHPIDFIASGSISTPGGRQVVPEPSTLLLSMAGLAAFAAVRARRRPC